MASNYGELIRWADSPRKEVVMYTVHFVENKDGYWWVVEIHGTDHFFPRATPSESYRLRDRLNAAQQSAHPTASGVEPFYETVRKLDRAAKEVIEKYGVG